MSAARALRVGDTVSIGETADDNVTANVLLGMTRSLDCGPGRVVAIAEEGEPHEDDEVTVEYVVRVTQPRNYVDPA